MEAVMERARRPRPVVDIEPAALTMEQAAAFCGRNKKQLYRDIAAGRLQTYKHGRCRMVLRTEMERHIRNLALGNYR